MNAVDLEDVIYTHGACLGVDPQVFFPDKPRMGRNPAPDFYATARRICAACPVRGECLDYALHERIVHGFWGGLDPDQRAVIRRQRRKACA